MIGQVLLESAALPEYPACWFQERMDSSMDSMHASVIPIAKCCYFAMANSLFEQEKHVAMHKTTLQIAKY